MKAMQTDNNGSHANSVPMEITLESFICSSWYLHFLCAPLIASEHKSHCLEMGRQRMQEEVLWLKPGAANRFSCCTTTNNSHSHPSREIRSGMHIWIASEMLRPHAHRSCISGHSNRHISKYINCFRHLKVISLFTSLKVATCDAEEISFP